MSSYRSAPVVVLVGLVLIATAACTSGDHNPPSGPTDAVTAPRPVPVTPGPPPPPGATGPPVVGVTTLPPVAVGEPAPFGGGLVASVLKIDQVQLEAQGPGEVAGPGVGVTVEFRNEAKDPIDLGGVVVNASYGNGVPANGSDSAPAAAATGDLPAGATRQGVYAFQVPAEVAGSLVVEVNYDGSPNVVLIRR